MKFLINPNNNIVHYFTKFAELMILSFFWVMLCMTVIGIGPATTAMYYAIAKSIRRNRGSAFKEFWSAFRTNFTKSTITGLLVTVFAVSVFWVDFPVIADFIVNGTEPEGKSILLFIVKTLVVFGLFLYMFPIQSRFQLKIVYIFLTSIGFMFQHFSSTLYMLLMLIAAVLLVVLLPYLIILVPACFFLVISYPMEKILRQHMPEEDAQENPEIDQWYLEK